MHSNIRYVPINQYSLREKIRWEKVKLEYLATKEYVVDIFIKPLSRETFEYVKQNMGFLYIPNHQQRKGQSQGKYHFPIDVKGEEIVDRVSIQ